jgi:hypothetical protein
MKYISNSAKETRKEGDLMGYKYMSEVGEGISSFALSENSHTNS